MTEHKAHPATHKRHNSLWRNNDRHVTRRVFTDPFNYGGAICQFDTGAQVGGVATLSVHTPHFRRFLGTWWCYLKDKFLRRPTSHIGRPVKRATEQVNVKLDQHTP